MTASRASSRRLGLAVLALALGPGCAGAGVSSAKAPEADVPELRVSGDKIAGKLWLAPMATRATAAGAGPLQVLGAEVASEGDRIGAFVEIPSGECMLALTRGSPSVGDIDLFSYEDDGDALATDESADAGAAILVCPPHPRRLYVVARVMAGSGIVSVGVQSVPVAVAAAVGAAVGARGTPGGDSGRLESWPGLEAKVRRHRESLGSRWEDVRRMAMPVTPRAATRFSVSIEPGRCVDVLVAPGDEVGSIEVVAEDDQARIVARAKERGRDRKLVLCSAVASELSIAVRPRGSQGLVAVIVGRSGVGAEAEITRGTTIDRVTETRELAEARAGLSAAIAGDYEAARTIATGTAKVGARATFPVDLPAGCVRIDVVAGKPLASVAAELWDAAGQRVASGGGGANASLFTCGPGGAARIDVEALARPGPFAIELRRDKAAPASLLAHPMAAGRLLGRLFAAGEPAAALSAAGAQVVAVEASRLSLHPAAMALPGCVEVIAAAGDGGTGLDLRLVDPATGESTLARAQHVVSGRICTTQTARPVGVELRLGTGKTDALVLVRPIAP